MLSTNKCLEVLDVSGNHLGKDYFSRCVGPALSENSTLQVLRLVVCELKWTSFPGWVPFCVYVKINMNSRGHAIYYAKQCRFQLFSNCCFYRCESVGATDLLVLTENCVKNSTLLELNISHNDVLDSMQLVQNIANWLQVK